MVRDGRKRKALKIEWRKEVENHNLIEILGGCNSNSGTTGRAF